MSSANVEPEKTYILRVQKKKATVAAKNQTKMEDENPVEINNDDKPLKSIAEVDVIPTQTFQRTPSFNNPWKSVDTDSEMGSNTSISNRQNIGLVVIVYGSATLVYIQLMLLAAFLQTTATPPGLVFLVTSLGLIGFIVFKVSG